MRTYRICPSWLLRCLPLVVACAWWFVGVPENGARADEALPTVLGEVYRPPEDPKELLKLDESMRRFFAERVSAGAPDSVQLRKIVEAILLPQGLNFTYDIEGTFDARETFRLRRGNCVSFSLLVVAVSREFGLQASFQNVSADEHWTRFGEIVASAMHVNVRVQTDAGAYVVDLMPELRRPGFDPIEKVHDERAFAQFYNNIGFFRLVHEQPVEALRYMTIAVKVDPQFSSAWANCANVQARLGDLMAARTCYERAIRADSRGFTAYAGLVAVLRRLGSPEDLRAADKLERKARAMQERSPYYQQYLAELARERGDWALAEKRLRRAISLKADEPEFHAQRVAALQHLGRMNDARRASEKLERLRARLAAVSSHFLP